VIILHGGTAGDSQPEANRLADTLVANGFHVAMGELIRLDARPVELSGAIVVFLTLHGNPQRPDIAVSLWGARTQGVPPNPFAFRQAVVSQKGETDDRVDVLRPPASGDCTARIEGPACEKGWMETVANALRAEAEVARVGWLPNERRQVA